LQQSGPHPAVSPPLACLYVADDIKFPLFDVVGDISPPPARLYVADDIKFPLFDVVGDISPPPACLYVADDIKFPLFDVVGDIRSPFPPASALSKREANSGAREIVPGVHLERSGEVDFFGTGLARRRFNLFPVLETTIVG
jgi:hypothetical protein